MNSVKTIKILAIALLSAQVMPAYGMLTAIRWTVAKALERKALELGIKEITLPKPQGPGIAGHLWPNDMLNYYIHVTPEDEKHQVFAVPVDIRGFAHMTLSYDLRPLPPLPVTNRGVGVYYGLFPYDELKKMIIDDKTEEEE